MKKVRLNIEQIRYINQAELSELQSPSDNFVVPKISTRMHDELQLFSEIWNVSFQLHYFTEIYVKHVLFQSVLYHLKRNSIAIADDSTHLHIVDSLNLHRDTLCW